MTLVPRHDWYGEMLVPVVLWKAVYQPSMPPFESGCMDGMA